MSYPEPRATWRRAVIASLAALFAVACLAGAASSCDSKDDKFSRDCRAKGGIVHTHHRGGSTSRTCDPPPVPRPGPQWQ
jgi:hypothetical protein